MAIEQYIQEPAVTNFSSEEEEEKASEDNRKSIFAEFGGSENTQSGGFECNICLDFVQDPVVTFCGHLYCWPCIYKWIHVQNISIEDTDEQQPQCPVCKASISLKTLVPLYGRGQTTNLSEGKALQVGIVIPQRPSSLRCGSQNLITAATHQQNRSSYPQQQHSQHRHVGNYAASPMPNLAMSTNVFNPTIGMFGEMVYARIFGNSPTSFYAYPNSYHLAGSNPRARRFEMEADKSLGRICFFLCCCTVLCLLLF